MKNIGLGMIALAASACANWEPETRFHAAWADDASEVAIVRVDYEIDVQSSKVVEERDHRYSISLHDPETGDRTLEVEGLEPEGDEDIFPQVFYMKSAGYILLDFGGVAHQYSLDDGSLRTFTSEPDYYGWVPSPSGAYLVSKLYDVNGLDQLGIQSATDGTWSMPFSDFGRPTVDFRWTLEDTLLVKAHGGADEDAFFEVEPGGDITEIDDPGCWDSPPTTSSDTSILGERLIIDDTTGELSFEQESRSEFVFGCGGA